LSYYLIVSNRSINRKYGNNQQYFKLVRKCTKVCFLCEKLHFSVCIPSYKIITKRKKIILCTSKDGTSNNICSMRKKNWYISPREIKIYFNVWRDVITIENSTEQKSMTSDIFFSKYFGNMGSNWRKLTPKLTG
jgi:hypothetical protein